MDELDTRQHSDTPDDVLDGWKAIAAHFGKSVRTVQRWKQEFDLPVRKFGGRDEERVWALRTELDEWRLKLGIRASTNGHHANGCPAGNVNAETPDRRSVHDASPAHSAFRWRRRWRAVLASVVIGASALAWLLTRPGPAGSSPALAHWQVAGDELAVYDQGKKLLWRYRFEWPLNVATYWQLSDSRQLASADGENVETGPKGAGLPRLERHMPLVVTVPSPTGDGSTDIWFVATKIGGLASRLFCFDSAGAVRWSFSPDTPLVFGDHVYPPPSHVTGVEVAPGPEGQMDLWVVAKDSNQFPSVVTRLDGFGRVKGSYVSGGHVAIIHVAKLAGRSWVFIGGPHNETGGASLAAMPVDEFGGAAPAADSNYLCSNCDSRRPPVFLVFPSNDISRELGGFPFVAFVHTNANGESFIDVQHDHRVLAGDTRYTYADVQYTIDRAFQVTAARYSSTFKMIHHVLQRAGRLDDTMAAHDGSDLWPVKRWVDNGWELVPAPER